MTDNTRQASLNSFSGICSKVALDQFQALNLLPFATAMYKLELISDVTGKKEKNETWNAWIRMSEVQQPNPSLTTL
ncbi:hypothetical protein KIN20_013445 [Parelaphostrongylus tenuis]|uniref:Uncharacterized protein n=1 Tax=Parelaphostrongylus tenuis TaxID=148309 RepID=A0AAD5MY49_PARTN|nr:hypothetical protein KIN20_013445 [Parelaphostrongylus tenuis]